MERRSTTGPAGVGPGPPWSVPARRTSPRPPRAVRRRGAAAGAASGAIFDDRRRRFGSRRRRSGRGIGGARGCGSGRPARRARRSGRRRGPRRPPPSRSRGSAGAWCRRRAPGARSRARPGGSGGGTKAKAPVASATTMSWTSPLRSSSTVAPARARPAMTASPDGSTRTMSKTAGSSSATASPTLGSSTLGSAAIGSSTRGSSTVSGEGARRIQRGDDPLRLRRGQRLLGGLRLGRDGGGGLGRLLGRRRLGGGDGGLRLDHGHGVIAAGPVVGRVETQRPCDQERYPYECDRTTPFDRHGLPFRLLLTAAGPAAER